MNDKRNLKTQYPWMFSAAIALLLAALALSVCVGKYPITLPEIGAILRGKGETVNAMTVQVFWELRLPRALMTALAGIGLGMAGSVYQTIFKNPLAAPDIIGVASGANLGAAIVIVLLGNVTLLVAGGAFIGGLLAVSAVMLLVRMTRINNTATYILSGIVITALSEALIMTLKFFADHENELATIEFWSMGSFGGVTAAKLLAVAPVFTFGLLGMILLRRQTALLSLEEDECRMLGLNIRQVRLVILSFSTLAIASVISVTGLISFIGLISPHIARLMLQRNNFSTGVMSALVGAIILVLADCLARTVYSAEVPISILTTLIGVPFLIYFMSNKKKGRL